MARPVQNEPVAVFDSPTAGTPSHTVDNPRSINSTGSVKVGAVFLVKTPPTEPCARVEVYLPDRPNSSSGWVDWSALRMSKIDYTAEVNLGARELKVFKSGVVQESFAVAVGSAATPTPTGVFYATELVRPLANSAYGPFIIGLSGFSEALDTFNGMPARIALHGTSRPDLLGSAVSNGCVRLSNDDITALAAILPMGTPVTIGG